uniref:ADP-ribosylglycohydrolase n=1 Tax=Pithovirus LCPAC404 TaxID=2506597 RepID=A0A481ZEB5_9VIRU|nr:MAG: ADP-ribosylglycohydrolase [Pithovirus LCPAC404]
MSINQDKIHGMLIGVAIGDALGAPHEFRTYTRADQYNGLIHLPIISQTRWQGKRIGAIGQVTDDTELSLALCSTLIEHRCYNENAAILAYLQWANTKPQMGRNTRKLFAGIKTIRGYRNRWKKEFESIPESEVSQSNGCLMRCSPLSVLDNWKEAVKLDCRISNPTSICIAACTVYVGSIRDLFNGSTVDEVLDNAIDQSESKEISSVLRDVKENKDRNVKGKTKGWILHAIYCAYSALMLDTSFNKSINFVINKGGDTDTNAAIAGAMLGARYGFEKLISNGVTEENIRMILKCDTNDGNLGPRPIMYHPLMIHDYSIKLSNF